MVGYRTYVAAALVAVFGVLQATDWVSLFSNPKAALPTIGIGILMAIMRSITGTPPGQSA